jgi:hypothetical protein
VTQRAAILNLQLRYEIRRHWRFRTDLPSTSSMAI